MKREFLKSIEGLTDEAIEKIIAENGKDIEATKLKADKSQEIEKIQSELNTTKQTLEAANVQIKSFEGLDVEGIKKSADDWKTKYETFEAQSKAEKEKWEKDLKDQQYDFTVKESIGGFKFPNELTKEAFYNKLKAKNLPIENNKLLGLDDYVKEIGEQNPGMFIAEQATNEPQIQFAAATSTSQVPTKGMTLIDAMKAGNTGQQVDLSQVGRFGTKQ